VSDARVEWDLGDDLPPHGSFDVMPMRTNDEGKAVASFKAVPETTPRPKRTFENQRSVSDAVIVQASGLVPDWERLSMIVSWLRPTGTQGRGNLEVRYYVDPCMEGGMPRPGQPLVLAQVAGATCQDSWSGMSTMLVQPGGHTVSAQVTWEWVSTAGGVVTYQPRGTASYRPAGNCSVSPSSVSGMEISGELNVDTTKDPPTFQGGAFAVWTGTYTCPEMPPFSAAAGGPWFFTMSGTVTENGRVIAGQNETVGTGSFRFTRN
jgi:hypothetical protein